MTDRADLIRRLEEAAKASEDMARQCAFDIMLERYHMNMLERYHMNRAALLREAAKALEGGE